MIAEEIYSIYDNCPFKGQIDEMDPAMVVLLCEGCPYFDECIEGE